ncbi:hypothetical protein [Halorussus caseinilyticus]|uniref:Uncharacterized protein n=1 Tax=Halorussus caseinilyticus TaxID=3034025 RepID=A0ABD5WI21_9EURY|nr:hypothetical protein [Halorussus sp. DT72]
MKFDKATIAFRDDDLASDLPHSNVELLDNGWVKATKFNESTDEGIDVYFSLDEVKYVQPL